MNLRRRTPTSLVLVTILVLSAALAGCMGDSSDDNPADANAEDGDLAASNTTDEDEQTRTGDPEPTVEEETFSFEGSGTGWGFEPVEGTCINCFWLQSEGAIQDLSVPDTYEEGEIEFSWEGGQSLGGMWLWVRDADENTVHVFHVDGSPFEVELDANDGRLSGASEVIVLPADTPAAAHVNVEWSGAFTFLVPQDGGEEAPTG